MTGLVENMSHARYVMPQQDDDWWKNFAITVIVILMVLFFLISTFRNKAEPDDLQYYELLEQQQLIDSLQHKIAADSILIARLQAKADSSYSAAMTSDEKFQKQFNDEKKQKRFRAIADLSADSSFRLFARRVSEIDTLGR